MFQQVPIRSWAQDYVLQKSTTENTFLSSMMKPVIIRLRFVNEGCERSSAEDTKIIPVRTALVVVVDDAVQMSMRSHGW